MITRNTPMQASLARGKKGFTLTEIAIVLGIIGLILGAIWVAASGVYANQRASKANTELLTIVQGIRSLYATQTQVDIAAGTDETLSLIRAGIFPTDTLSTGNPNTAATPANAPWSGSVIRIYSSTISNAGDAFEVVFGSVPQQACINLLTASTGTGKDQSLQMATAANGGNTQTGTATYQAYAATNFPIAVGAATTSCGSRFNDVAFVYALRG